MALLELVVLLAWVELDDHIALLDRFSCLEQTRDLQGVSADGGRHQHDRVGCAQFAGGMDFDLHVSGFYFGDGNRI